LKNSGRQIEQEVYEKGGKNSDTLLTPDVEIPATPGVGRVNALDPFPFKKLVIRGGKKRILPAVQ
jgi:hypothetical protein